MSERIILRNLVLACGLLAVVALLASGVFASPSEPAQGIDRRVVAPAQTAVPAGVTADGGGMGLGEDPVAIFIAAGLVVAFIIGLILSRRRR